MVSSSGTLRKQIQEILGIRLVKGTEHPELLVRWNNGEIEWESIITLKISLTCKHVNKYRSNSPENEEQYKKVEQRVEEEVEEKKVTGVSRLWTHYNKPKVFLDFSDGSRQMKFAVAGPIETDEEITNSPNISFDHPLVKKYLEENKNSPKMKKIGDNMSKRTAKRAKRPQQMDNSFGMEKKIRSDDEPYSANTTVEGDDYRGDEEDGIPDVPEEMNIQMTSSEKEQKETTPEDLTIDVTRENSSTDSEKDSEKEKHEKTSSNSPSSSVIFLAEFEPIEVDDVSLPKPRSSVDVDPKDKWLSVEPETLHFGPPYRDHLHIFIVNRHTSQMIVTLKVIGEGVVLTEKKKNNEKIVLDGGEEKKVRVSVVPEKWKKEDSIHISWNSVKVQETVNINLISR